MSSYGFNEIDGTSKKEILFSTQPMLAVGVQVGNTGVSADANGKKIIKEGTPLTGSLTARTTAFSVASDTNNVSNAVGILYGGDLDVTDGTQNATLLILGFVNWDKLDSTVKTLTTTYTKTALNMIKYIA